MTQELVASMLGVRWQGITEAAGKLQHALARRDAAPDTPEGCALRFSK